MAKTKTPGYKTRVDLIAEVADLKLRAKELEQHSDFLTKKLDLVTELGDLLEAMAKERDERANKYAHALAHLSVNQMESELNR